MDILIDLHKNEKKTIIVVTHDPTIANYSSQVVHIKDGQLASNHFAEEKVLWSKK
jgi:ABC-type lipoprotein export system ATPase subunit